MNIEDQIIECELNLNQIKRFDPEPYYVNYFFKHFIKAVNNVYEGIFEEANNDFGLFVKGRCNKEKFHEKAKTKKDQKAIEFVNWFENRIKIEHETPYPNFIMHVIKFEEDFHKLPRIKIMIRPKERYSDDKLVEIKIDLKNEKLRSKEELEIEIKRNMPVFLEVINQKRLSNGEPKVTTKNTTVSTFMENGLGKDFEVVYSMEVYLPVLKRFLVESRKKIKTITRLNSTA